MIESFSVPKNQVAKWAGVTSAAFNLSQCCTAIFWGRASDRFGRKPVIMCGLFCTMATSMLFGFSPSLPWAIVARSLGGAGNGNVGIIRTMVAEMVPQKELQPRAFSVMPLVWTIGSIIGPAGGGALANPAHTYPGVFGNNVFFKRFPYALPNLVASIFFFVGIATGILYLRETLETKKGRRDYGLEIGRRLKAYLTWKRKPSDEDERAPLMKKHHHHHRAYADEEDSLSDTATDESTTVKPVAFSEVFSRQSSINLGVYTLLALHCNGYDQLLPIFMHYPPLEDNSERSLPFKFSGGFGIGTCLS